MRVSIIVLPGDGIGPEVTNEAVRVMRAVGDVFEHEFTFTEELIGGAAIDATGEPLPFATITACRRADAVLLGAVGGPKWEDPKSNVRPEQGLLQLRKALGAYANLRPVSVHTAGARVSPMRIDRLLDVDLMFVRELTGGSYFGNKGRDAEHAWDTCTYHKYEVERVTRMAANLARSRRGKLTSIDKANVLETSRLWRSTVTQLVAEEFPDLQLEHVHVDAAAMLILQKPAEFDVLVTENMFGDILTDEAAVLAGSIGLLPSASLGGGVGIYEPIHGSAPAMAGRNQANPIGAILSAAMMLRHSLNLETEARAIERAVRSTLDLGVLTADLQTDRTHVASTSMVGDAVVNQLLLAKANLAHA